MLNLQDWYFRKGSQNGDESSWSEHDGSLTLQDLLVSPNKPFPNIPLDSSLTVALYASLLLQSGSSPEFSQATKTLDSYNDVLMRHGDIKIGEHINISIKITEEINRRWGRNKDEIVFAYFVITDFDGYIEAQNKEVNIFEFEGFERESADSKGWLIYNHAEQHIGIMVSKVPYANLGDKKTFEYRRRLDGPGIIKEIK